MDHLYHGYVSQNHRVYIRPYNRWPGHCGSTAWIASLVNQCPSKHTSSVKSTLKLMWDVIGFLPLPVENCYTSCSFPVGFLRVFKPPKLPQVSEAAWSRRNRNHPKQLKTPQQDLKHVLKQDFWKKRRKTSGPSGTPRPWRSPLALEPFSTPTLPELFFTIASGKLLEFTMEDYGKSPLTMENHHSKLAKSTWTISGPWLQ